MENILNTVVMISTMSPSHTMTQPAWPEIEGEDESPKDSELSIWRVWIGWHRESDRQKTSAKSHGNFEAHMVLSWYWRNEWHMNETSSPFHCACLVCPLSFLHQRIFTDTTTPPPPLSLQWHTSHWITRGYGALCPTFTTDIYLSKSAVPFSRGNLYPLITAVRHYIHLLFI